MHTIIESRSWLKYILYGIFNRIKVYRINYFVLTGGGELGWDEGVIPSSSSDQLYEQIERTFPLDWKVRWRFYFSIYSKSLNRIRHLVHNSCWSHLRSQSEATNCIYNIIIGDYHVKIVDFQLKMLFGVGGLFSEWDFI